MFNYQIKGDDAVLSKLRNIESSSLRAEIMDDIAAYLLLSTHERFENAKDPDGKPWVQSYRAKTQGGKTLSNKGFLRDSFTTSSSANHAAVGTNHISARLHQLGGEIVPKNSDGLYFRIGGHFIKAQKVVMPARPMVGLSSADRVEIPEIINEHLRGALRL